MRWNVIYSWYKDKCIEYNKFYCRKVTVNSVENSTLKKQIIIRYVVLPFFSLSDDKAIFKGKTDKKIEKLPLAFFLNRSE